MKRMFAKIRTLQSATNIGNVAIQIYLCQIVTTKSGLTIRQLVNTSKNPFVQKYKNTAQRNNLIKNVTKNHGKIVSMFHIKTVRRFIKKFQNRFLKKGHSGFAMEA